MKTRHIVLRSGNGSSALRDVFRGARSRGVWRADMEAHVSTLVAELHVEVADLSSRDIPALARDTDVLAIAPAMPMRLIEPVSVSAVTPADAADTAWGVHAVKADTSPFTGQGITVAVLDTGIDPHHEAFAGMQLVRENFTEEGEDDIHGHGTHCAGTIFGRRTSGMRIGVAPGVQRAVIAKVLGQGGGSSEQLIKAIQWATDRGAQIISMSLGIDFPGFVKEMVELQGLPVDLATSRALESYRLNVLLFERMASLLLAHPQPTLIVAAAGNDSRRELDARYEISVSPPAVSEGILSVAALGAGGEGMRVADFSNIGANVSGPGVDVLSAKQGGGLVSMSGTSMATPHVAGVAALWAEKIQRVGPLTTRQLAAKLVGTAAFDGLRNGFDAVDVGAGIVQAPRV